MKLMSIQIVLLSTFLYGQEAYTETAAWESEDLQPIYASFDSTQNYIIKPGILLAHTFIGFYQKKISTQSISRCPFYISCSNYAYLAVRKYGLLPGICFFIDRNFYRENIASFYYYQLRENAYGVLKLDDSFYLFGKEYR